MPTAHPPIDRATPPSVIYRDSRVASIIYAVRRDLAQELLANTGLVAVHWGAYALAHAAWFDYGTSSIGSYREFSLGIMASTEPLRPRAIASLLLGKAGRVGSYVLALPVDSELARSGGVERYGLPKTLLDLELDWSPAELRAKVASTAGPLLSMRVPLGLGIPALIRQLVVFSVRNGQVLTTPIGMRWLARIDLVGRPQLTVEDRDHPMGAIMSRLDLESAHPLAVAHGRIYRAELPPPKTQLR